MFLLGILVLARARVVTIQFRQVRGSLVWASFCQDVTPGGHAGVGVISLHGVPLSLPTLLEFFRVGRVMRVVLFFWQWWCSSPLCH